MLPAVSPRPYVFVAHTKRRLGWAEQQAIEEMVRKIINNKFIDGQLDECDLTLRDLDKICQSFVRLLSAIHHSRLTYPKQQHNGD